ncbi:ArsR/SmtB family transcription factor [Rugosimonospora africana]|uniref:Transcriptional regulator n=1 Tax=Rugosimonospora africana TaxID=556532 RepID=A0A8J3VSX0_9ACTN|nr:helix-turn-helix transcriptional regulator [Rugosimonospora africana]GIH17469.1 transcriptional regulator [Rugosimonospora africana]
MSTARSTGAPRGDADIARVAALFADRSRARVLIALSDGRRLPASVLAAEAGVSAAAMSAHLNKLRAESLIAVEQSGRHRYYSIAGPKVAATLEALAAIAPAQPVTSLRQGTRAQRLREARTCYDHLAGALGVEVTQALIDRGALVATDGVPDTARRPGDRLSAPVREHPYRLGPAAAEVLRDLGVDLPALLAGTSGGTRPVLRFCLDWTEQRHHLAGALGAALSGALFDAGWIARRRAPREVELTAAGAVAIEEVLGIHPAAND